PPHPHASAPFGGGPRRFDAVAFDWPVVAVESPIGRKILKRVRTMRFPDLEGVLLILRHHGIHEMLDGMLFADEAKEKEPNAKGNQNNQRDAAYRVAEPF